MEIKITDNSQKILQEFESKEQEILDEMGRIVQNKATKKTPVRTGLLRGSLDRKVHKHFVEVGYLADAFKSAGKKPYAKFVEFGTRFMSGQHMIKNSLNESMEELKQTAERMMKK